MDPKVAVEAVGREGEQGRYEKWERGCEEERRRGRGWWSACLVPSVRATLDTRPGLKGVTPLGVEAIKESPRQRWALDPGPWTLESPR